jgi:hypothetical protein
MPWHRCFIRGENFPGCLMKIEGPLAGFYTTRWVEVSTPQEAEGAAIALLRADPALVVPEGKPRPTNAKIYVEEIVTAHSRGKQGTGFAWFDMADSEGATAARRLERATHW